MRAGFSPLFVAVVVVGLSCSPQGEDSRIEARPNSGTVIVDEAELGWVREGQGPSVFILGSSVYYPKAYSAQLRDHFELVFVDGRHFVPSYAPDEETLSSVDLSTFADDVEAVRVALGYEEIAIVGHSVHGQIALEYADRYPESTTKVLLIGAVPYAFPEFADAANEVWEELASDERKVLLDSRVETLNQLLEATPASRSFAVSYAQQSPLYWANPSFDATALLDGLENGPAFGRLTGSLPSRTEARARLERIDIPILIILGKLDFAIPYTAWDSLIDGLPNVEQILLEQDSHNPQTESPERFDALMIEWLSGI